MKHSSKFTVVGKSQSKVDGRALATGRAKFTDDVEFHGLLHAKLLYSPHPHAIIKNIDTVEAEGLAGVKAVLTYKNVPRIVHTTAGQGYPEPSPYDTFLFDNKVRFVGDRVAAVAADTPEIAEQAIRLIKVGYKILEPVFDPKQAIKRDAPIIHDEKEAFSLISAPYKPEGNIAAEVKVNIGDIKKALKQADMVAEHEYETQYVAHCPLEPHIVITYLDEAGRLVIRTSTQVPFHVRRIVARCLNLPVADIRVIKPRIGGGFGGKQEIVLEGVCAAITLKTGRPVKLQYSRQEEFISARTRHPQHIRLKTGAKKDGRLTAIEMKVLMNTGAYGSHALTVLNNTGSKSLGLYKTPNVRFVGQSVYTNLPVAGACRGYGAVQGHFALQVQLDEMAGKLGIDPIEFHRLNHIQTGDVSPVLQAIGEAKAGVKQPLSSCNLEECLEVGAKAIGWQKKRNRARPQKGHLWRGVGMACLMQGSSIPEIDMAGAIIKMNEDGSFNLLIGATDLGTGSDTVLAQIAAETLSVDLDKILVYSSDTDFTPFDSGAYASSTTYLSGLAVKEAAEKIKAAMLEVAAQMLGQTANKLELSQNRVRLKGSRKTVSYKDLGHYAMYQRNQQQLCASASRISHLSPPPFAAHFAEVEVDIETGQVKVLKYVAAVDCGTAINPQLAEGQTEGAIVQGLGMALTEEYLFGRQGQMLNPNFHHYKIPGIQDIPEIKVFILPGYDPTGPYGAKSVSEISTNGPLPVISNAIYDATGIRLRRSPFAPDRLLSAFKKKNLS